MADSLNGTVSPLWPLLAAFARHPAAQPDAPEPANNAEPVTPAAGPRENRASGEDRPPAPTKPEGPTMNQHENRTSRELCLITAANLLAHSRTCPDCFPAFALGLKLGNGCPIGQDLRRRWVGAVEARQLAEPTRATPQRCEHCEG